MWSDKLTTAEAEYTSKAIDSLSGQQWAQPIINRLSQAGGISAKNMPLMFEVRFAYELHRAGRIAEYEFNAGIGDSTVEFKVAGKITWLIELVSIRPSQALKRATTNYGLVYHQLLTTAAKDKAQSEEAEMITAEQKIGEKVFTSGMPTKFPIPMDDIYHLILVDMRGYLDEGGDIFDYRQIAYGAQGIPSSHFWMIHYWEKDPGKLEPISGLFEESCPLRAAPLIRERVHFLGFIRERQYREGEITDRTYCLANPHLMKYEEAKQIYNTYPLAISKL